MSTLPQHEESAVQNQASPTTAPSIGEPPAPSTRTVIVTDRPALIPDESANALCLTRRNIFDTIIAFLLVAGIIYLVFYWRQTRPITGLTRAMNTGTAFGRTTTATGARGFGQGTDLSGIGRQIAGALKKLFK